MDSQTLLYLKGNPVAKKLGAVIPKYPDDVSESKAGLQSIIEIGQQFNVISLLSGDGEMNYLHRISGDRVEVEEKMFSNKNIIVCCFHVPIFRVDDDSLYLQSLINTCSELYSKDNLEMVVVAKMNTLANYEGIFDHFLSGFPTWCLAVPFEDSKRRDFICSVVLNYGAEAFPFTQDCLHKLGKPDIPYWKTSSTSTLEGLLQCNSSFVLGKTNPSISSTCISQLKGKVVGLYLCWEGDFIPKLNDVYKQCKKKSLAFEIVLVYMPFGDCLDLEVFMGKIDSMLRDCNACWWCFPFNNSVSHRLGRLAFGCREDRLIIVGPNGEFVDPYGREVMNSYGCDYYPFTREALVQRKVNNLKELKLESLFVHCNDTFLHLVQELQGKNILVFLDSLSQFELSLELNRWYQNMKKQESSSSFEVVFVRLYRRHVNIVDTDSSLSESMPWLVCPFDPDHSTFVEKKLFGERGVSNALVGFDQNGRICTLDARERLESKGSAAFPFDDNLRQDVIDQLRCHAFHDFMNYF
ncbi:hypothetical protein SOVF_081260 [Spinacia oleracea]|nr:hypothetical protein SOVF_081260 [Spinacia oleracea]